MAMTPRARSSADSEASLVRAPRSLNELVTCRFSYLTNTSAPVSADSLGAGSIGVRSTWPAMIRRAASISARVTVNGLRSNRGFVATNLVQIPATTSCGAVPLANGCFLPIFLGTEGGFANHGPERTQATRRVGRTQTPRLRPSHQPRTVRRRGAAPGDRLRDRFPHPVDSGGVPVDVHLRHRHRHLRAGLPVLRPVVARHGDLGARLLRPDAR